MNASNNLDLTSETLQKLHQERKRLGSLRWAPCRDPRPFRHTTHPSPYFSGEEHFVKDATFYSTLDSNLWNIPLRSGPKTWRFLHGPQLSAGAASLEELDRRGAANEKWAAKRNLVLSAKTSAQMRMELRKGVRQKAEDLQTVVPLRRERKAFVEHENNWTDLNSLSRTALRLILTPEVIAKDHEAFLHVQKGKMQEAQIEDAGERWKAERRLDLLMHARKRRMINDELEKRAGQYGRPPTQPIPTRPSSEWDRLATPKKFSGQCVSPLLGMDFKGLVHIEYRPALLTVTKKCLTEREGAGERDIFFHQDSTRGSRTLTKGFREKEGTSQLRDPQQADLRALSADIEGFEKKLYRMTEDSRMTVDFKYPPHSCARAPE